FGRRAQSQIGLRADQIDYGLGLSEVHLAIEEGALSEFARAPRARTSAQARFEDRCGNQRSSMATDLDQILSSVTGRRAVDRKHYLIDQSAVQPKNPAKMLHVRFKSRRRLFAMKDFVCYLDRIRARDPHKRNGAFARRSGNGGDGVRNGHDSRITNCRASASVAKSRRRPRSASFRRRGTKANFLKSGRAPILVQISVSH